MTRSKHTSKTPSQRQLRVGEQLRHVIAETLRRGKFSNPGLRDAARGITVSEVRAAPDLKTARVYVSTWSGDGVDAFLPLLNKEASAFQKDLGKVLNMKSTPRLTFAVDESFDEAQKIETILHEIADAQPEEI